MTDSEKTSFLRREEENHLKSLQIKTLTKENGKFPQRKNL